MVSAQGACCKCSVIKANGAMTIYPEFALAVQNTGEKWACTVH